MLSEIKSGAPIPLEVRAYFHARTKNRLFDFILSKFIEKEMSGELTKAELARRMEKRPEVVTRLLSAPGNWTLETVSDLLLGIGAEELEPASSSLLNRPPRNYSGEGIESSNPLDVETSTKKELVIDQETKIKFRAAT